MTHRRASSNVATAEPDKGGHTGALATLAALLTSGIIALVALTLPDIRRYLKIASM